MRKSRAKRPDWKEAHRAGLVARNTATRAGFMPYADREWIRTRYEDQRLSLRKISEEARCGIRTIVRWMEQHQIPVRTMREAGVLRRGKPIKPLNPKRLCPKCGRRKNPSSLHCINCRDLRGKRNGNYRGIADATALIRQWTSTYWRPEILKRDNYTCLRCGDDRGHNLRAHHITPLSVIIKHLKWRWLQQLARPLLSAADRVAFAKFVIDDWWTRSLDNGMTICDRCHREFHAKRFQMDGLSEFAQHPVGFRQAMQNGQFRGVVLRVIDGDTYRSVCDLGFFIYKVVDIRLADVNTAEVVGTERAAGLAAKAFVSERLTGRPVLLKTRLDKSGGDEMSFIRYVADIEVLDATVGDWFDLAEIIRAAGFDKLHPVTP